MFHSTMTWFIFKSNQPNSFLYSFPYFSFLKCHQTVAECLGRARLGGSGLLTSPWLSFQLASSHGPGVITSPQPLLCLHPRSLVLGSAQQQKKKKKNNIPEDNLFSCENWMGGHKRADDAGSNPFPGRRRHPGHITDLESSRCPPDLANRFTDK